MSQNSTNKPLRNPEIAELLRDVAAAYQLSDEKKYRFKIIAYQRAADAIEHATSELRDLWEEKNLDSVPGLGKSITEHLEEIFTTGSSKHFEDLMKDLPKAMFSLMKVPGIGPKKAYRLSVEFKLPDKDPFTALKKVAEQGKIAELSGFGEESQADILQSLLEYKEKAPERMLISTATEISDDIIAWLKKCKAVKNVNTLGSLRRKAASVGDIDISVASNDSQAVFDHFVAYPGAARVIERGQFSSSILLPGNIQVDVMVQPEEAYGSLLQHFTGSKHHNIALRELSLKKGLSLSERGIKPLKEGTHKFKNGTFNKELGLFQFEQEEDFYNALGLQWIPPELREGTGEIGLAETDTLPELVELTDVKGDLQIHSDFDIETSHDVGASSMKEIVDKALALNYEYIAFTEHNPSQKGHDAGDVNHLIKLKKEVIEQLNYSVKSSVKGRTFKVFNSLEIDILPSGKLPVNDEGLNLLDFALVSIHSSFKLSKSEMTKRVLNALSHPKVKIFAHPTARLINKREGVDLDWDAIFDFSIKNRKIIEINADPHRLDLPDALVRQGKKYGVMFSFGTDSHHVDALMNMRYGVYVARRGGLASNDIINTRSLNEFESLMIEKGR